MVVGRLVEQGVAIIETSAIDARRVEISIMSRGLTLIRRAPEPIQERLIAAIESLPPTSRERLSAGLRAVVKSAGISEGPAPLFFF